MHLFGIILGWVLVAGFVLTSLKYLTKLINQKKIMALPKDSPLRKEYTVFMRMVFRSHQYIPLYLMTVLILHILIELIHKGFIITGFMAAFLMILQVVLGAYGTMVKDKKKGFWLYAHRTTAALLLVIIVLHIIMVWGLPLD
jgi:hypothetical protein